MRYHIWVTKIKWNGINIVHLSKLETIKSVELDSMNVRIYCNILNYMHFSLANNTKKKTKPKPSQWIVAFDGLIKLIELMLCFLWLEKGLVTNGKDEEGELLKHWKH